MNNHSINFQIKNDHKNIIYSISIRNTINELFISINNNLYKYYESNFTLNDIQKVKYFIIYDNVEECMPDIIEGINTNKSSIKEEHENLVLTIPILNKKYKSIPLIIKKKQKIKVIKEQNILIENLQNEITNLKNEVRNLQAQNYMNRPRPILYNQNNLISININIDDKMMKNFIFKSNDKINKIIELVKKEFIINDNFNIIYNEQILDDYNKTFEYYNINDNSTIIFKNYSIGGQYFVRTLSGKTIILDLLGSETIFDIKKKIEEKEGIPIEEQRLVLAGKQLEDKKTIQFYQIPNESTFQLVFQLR